MTSHWIKAMDSGVNEIWCHHSLPMTLTKELGLLNPLCLPTGEMRVLTLTLPSAGVHSSLRWGSLFPPPHHNQLLLILQGSAVLSEGFLTPHVLLQFPMTVSSIIHHPIAH